MENIFGNLSMNPNITWDIVSTNSDKQWDWSRVSQNLFSKHPLVLIRNLENKNMIRIKKIFSDDRLYTDINSVIFSYV